MRANGMTLAGIAWAALIVLVCSLPVPPEAEGASLLDWLPMPPDKAAHFGLFAVFGALWLRAGTSGGAWRWAWVAALGAAFGVATELWQGLAIIGRDPEIQDALADAAGVAAGVGALAAWGYSRRWRRAPAALGSAD